MTLSRWTIAYVLPFATEGDADYSFLQGFSNGLLHSAGIIRFITRLPSSVEELALSKIQMRRARARGMSSFMIVPIEIRYLSDLDLSSHYPFCVVFSSEPTAEVVQQWCQSISPRPLHVSERPNRDAIPFRHFTRSRLRQYVRRVMVCHQDRLPEAMSIAPKWTRRKPLALDRTNHNTSAPNEDTLFAAGFGFRKSDHLTPTSEDANQPYLNSIVHTANKVLDVREQLPFGPSAVPDVIVTTPGLYRDHLRHLLKSRSLLRRTFGFEARAALKAIREQAHYSMRFTEGPGLHVMDPDQAQLFRSVLAYRSKELHLYTAALSARAASELSAVVRLPPVCLPVLDAARRVGDCARGRSAHKRRKLRQCIGRLSEALDRYVPEDIARIIRRSRSGIRVVSDFPLEWLSSDHGLPLMLTHDVSRLTSTPGNVLLNQLLPGAPILVSERSLDSLLIVRSFAPDDPVGSLIDHALRIFQQSLGADFNARIVDVSTVDEFTDALNGYDGAWMVFDGHGSHSRNKQGTLRIGNTSVDPWELKGRVRIPPIVVLSTCDTQPIDREHPSTANGFLVLGARTVVASLLPIDGFLAATFLVRLLHSARGMVPGLFAAGMPYVRWSTVFSRTLRSQLFVELSQHLMKQHGVEAEDTTFLAAQVFSRLLVASGNPDWYIESLNHVAQATGVASGELEKMLEELAPLQCTLYTQMGDPESILLISPALSSDQTPSLDD